MLGWVRTMLRHAWIQFNVHRPEAGHRSVDDMRPWEKADNGQTRKIYKILYSEDLIFLQNSFQSAPLREVNPEV